MRRFLWLALLAVLGELVSVVLMADLVGALPTLGLLLLGAMAGAAILRGIGRAAIAELRREAGWRRVDARVLVGGSRLALIAVLLIVPGFLSDLAALALALRTAPALLGRRAGFPLAARRRPPATVELRPDEWRRMEGPDRRAGGF